MVCTNHVWPNQWTFIAGGRTQTVRRRMRFYAKQQKMSFQFWTALNHPSHPWQSYQRISMRCRFKCIDAKYAYALRKFKIFSQTIIFAVLELVNSTMFLSDDTEWYYRWSHLTAIFQHKYPIWWAHSPKNTNAIGKSWVQTLDTTFKIESIEKTISKIGNHAKCNASLSGVLFITSRSNRRKASTLFSMNTRRNLSHFILFAYLFW